MFEKLSVDTSYETFYRDITKHKSIKVLAKIDGENWYDISKFVKKVTVNNQIQLLDVPTIDTAKLTVKNDNNAFTSTVYNDEFNPSAGKINGTIEQGYLNKIWEVQVYTVIYDVDNRDCLDLPDGAIAYFRYTLVDVVNGITPVGYELTPETLMDVAIPLFRGWKPAQAIVEKHKEAEIELKDMLWITTQKRLKNPLLYTSMTPSAIIADLLNRCGLGSSYQDLQPLNTTFDVFIAEQDKSYWQIIQNICEATAGIISTAPDGKIIYRTRIENFTDPEIALTINQDTFSKYNLEQKAKYNQLKVESEGYEISTSNEDLLVDTTLTGDAAIIKAGQTQNFEFEYTSEFAKDFADTVFITVMQGDTIVDNLGAFSQGDDDGFIRVNKLTAYPDKLVLNITNLASTVDYTIAQVRFRGRQIKKLSLNTVEEPNITDEPDNEISIKSFYSDTSILSNILDALKFNINKDIVFSLSLNEFYPDIFAGNLVNFNIPLKGIASGTFIIEQIKHIINDDLSYNTELVISEWKDVVFDINSKEIYKSTPVEVITESSEQSQIEEIIGNIEELKEDVQEQKDITSFLDGRAPDTPTGLLVTTEIINQESVLKVSFNPNTEMDLLGYEIAYSQDSVWWQYNVVSETSVYIQVIGNTEYFVKVRAFDAEGFKSAWTNVVSIVSAKDTIPPEAPTGLTVEPLFQKIIVKWTPNEEPDLLKYKVEVSLDNFDTVKDTIYTDSNYIVYGGKTNTLYYFRVSAIDTSENMSEYSNVVSATTTAVYDEDLESAILNELNENLEELNNVTLPELQEDLQELQDLTGYLDGEAPNTPTGLALDTELIDDEAVIEVSFNANTETDIIGYEVAYSTDQVKWSYVNTTETSLYISVIPNTRYYVRIRAFDAEGFKSAWTNVVSIVSAKDTIPPEAPTGLTVEPLFQKIIVKWTPNTEPDLDKYKVEVSLDNFDTVKDNIYTDSNYIVYAGTTNTTYYFRVLAVDTSNNQSGYSEVVSATTAAVYDEDLESAILDGLANDLEELNNVTLPGLQEDLQELQDLTGFMDGEAPATPTGLALTTELLNDESVIKVSFTANTETDIIGYEVAYSTDQIKWHYVTTTDTTVYLSVIANTLYYVRVRAFDAEGYKSSWTSTQSIVSAKDITSPSTPSGLVVEALFQKIVLKWNPNTEKDFEKYKAQVSKDNFTTVEETLYTSSNYLVYGGDTDTKYYFRVSAIDTSGNESNFSAIVNATTAKVYDEDLESEILNGLEDDLEELNTVTLPNLQSELDSKLDDLPGEIKETHIADNSISTAKIKANAVTANEINAGAVTSDKIAANAITANKVGANQIITNSANIANGIIDTVHIKDAAIQTAKIKDGAITNAKIANAAIDDAKIANLDASKITSGYIDAERIAADSITVSKLVAKPSFSLPEGAIAYFTDSLVDNVSGITPVGYDEINLSPKITLMPENAPEGSIIAPLMIADKIYADHIASNAITSDKILANAVTSDKIAANAITANHIGVNEIITNSANIGEAVIDTVHIKDAAISSAKIADAAITNAKIGNLAVDDAKIANVNAAKINAGYINADRIASNTITADHIASNAITSEKIAANAITTDKLDANAVTSEKIAANAITADKILANAVTSAKIAASAITAEKIGTNQIITNSANIATGVIETAHIKDAAISTAKIANAAITNAKIGTAAVDTANIADLAVTNAKIANLDAAKITSGYIDADRIASNAITADKIVVEGRNFIIKDLQITPTKNKIEWTTFTLQELAEDTTYTVGSASSTYTSTVTYYLIVRINKNDPNNMNSQNILYTSSTLDKGQIGDFTYYPLGTVKFITNEIPIVSIDKGFTKIHGDYIQTGTVQADYIRVGSDADTRVSEGEEANQIVQENKNVWDQAAINAQNALSNISDMSSDSKITPTEKINLKREFDIATQEKTNVVLTAESIRDNAGNEIPTIVTAKTNLITAYNALNTYVSPLLVDMSVTSDVNSTTLTQKFTDFYDKLNGVYKAIDEHLNVARNFADNVAANGYTEIDGGKITTFILAANKYIQAGTADRNYKLDGTQGLIRTIGTNTYNIYSYVTSGEVNFDGTVTYKDIDLTNYGLTDYIAILNFQQTQFWRSDWTTSKNLTLTYEKISSNILRILAYFSDDVVWTTKTGPTISFSSYNTWHTLVTTAADTTGARVYWTATLESVTISNTLTHYYRVPETYTIKVRADMRTSQYISIDWGDGIITTDGPYVASWFIPYDYSFKYVAEGHSGNPQPLFGKINYAVLGY